MTSTTNELLTYLRDFAARARAARWFGALFHVGVVQNIAADVVETEGEAADLVALAEKQDREAAELIRSSLSDNRITADEIPLLRRALRKIEASAANDGTARSLFTEFPNPAT